MKIHNFMVPLLLCLLSTGRTHAENPHWTCDSHAYEHDMALYFNMRLLGQQLTALDEYTVAAFCGDECRGVSATIATGTGLTGYLRIRSNTPQGETISLKVYKQSTDEVYNVVNTLTFTDQDLIGMPNEPLTLTLRNNKPVTLTAVSVSRLCGESNPVFTFTAEGAELEGSPVLVCEAGLDSPVGTYPIVITAGSVVNDYVTYVNGILTIEPVDSLVGEQQVLADSLAEQAAHLDSLIADAGQTLAALQQAAAEASNATELLKEIAGLTDAFDQLAVLQEAFSQLIAEIAQLTESATTIQDIQRLKEEIAALTAQLTAAQNALDEIVQQLTALATAVNTPHWQGATQRIFDLHGHCLPATIAPGGLQSRGLHIVGHRKIIRR